MSMMWVRKQSKWGIYIVALLAVVIGGSLIMMDQPSRNGMSGTQAVGEVDGEEITAMMFQQNLQNFVRNEEARTGRQPQGIEHAQIRAHVFQLQVQSLLFQGMAKAYDLRATPDEMRDWLAKNPREVANSLVQYQGAEALPYFFRDSTLDPATYRYWLLQDSVLTRPGIRALEYQLKVELIPQMQIQQIFRSQLHRTDLEEAFLVDLRENKAALRYYRVAGGSFPVDPASLDEKALREHFEARPDSFWFHDEAASLSYTRLPLVPSAADTALMRNFAGEVRERAVAGESFEDLARNYSSDAASAEKGGRLPPTAASEWVPAFANAAFSLAPGQMSEPVLTQFGYHIILMHEKTRVDGVEKASVSHILLNITTGSETTDSLLAIAETLREKAAESGLEAAASSAGLSVQKTPVFAKANLAPLGIYVPGVSAFAFNKSERKAKVSQVLQSDEGIYILARDAMYPQGRDFERSREAVAKDLAQTKQLAAAREAAENLLPKITDAANSAAPAAMMGPALLETTGLITADAYSAGFGFGSTALYKALQQKPGAWGPVLATPEGAVVAQVLAAQPLSAPEKAQRIQAARMESDTYQVSNLYQEWSVSLPKAMRVKDNLSELFPN
jgi:hypothetical protein